MCEIEYSFIWFQREKESRIDSSIEQSINFIRCRHAIEQQGNFRSIGRWHSPPIGIVGVVTSGSATACVLNFNSFSNNGLRFDSSSFNGLRM